MPARSMSLPARIRKRVRAACGCLQDDTLATTVERRINHRRFQRRLHHGRVGSRLIFALVVVLGFAACDHYFHWTWIAKAVDYCLAAVAEWILFGPST